jgi:ubiquinone/menaquinone biosynthesis C-methylase UbiE
VAEMRAKISEKLPTVKALEGTSWNIPVDAESQDVVVIAQAFHWFDDIETLRECRRVLKPNGRIVFIWNMESQNRSQWIAKLRKCVIVVNIVRKRNILT